jgi:regulator of protease activity HflC (stomatin/prohibitin superfamily)
MNRFAKLALTGAVLSTITLSGCVKSYDTPEYVEVDTAETAFVVSLEGDSANQAKFQSEKMLEQMKVADKRIQITHRWNQTGRMDSDGAWIPNVRVIKVNRSPITREWTADAKGGTSPKDQAIWVESQDSVGFSMGFTATGYVKEEDAAMFLYWYPATDKDGVASLASVMDTEVRARVQQAVSSVAAKYPLDILRAKKQEMTDTAREDVVEFFKTRGITITTVASFGGMTYENPKIQDAIDQVFIAQQQKDVNLAAFEAQQKANEKITLAAEATATAKVTEAQGEAKALLAKAQAAKEAGSALFELRQLEIDQARVEKWDGHYPMYLFGAMPGEKSPTMLLNVPTTQETK